MIGIFIVGVAIGSIITYIVITQIVPNFQRQREKQEKKLYEQLKRKYDKK